MDLRWKCVDFAQQRFSKHNYRRSGEVGRNGYERPTCGRQHEAGDAHDYVEGLVAAVDGGQIVLNVGSKLGLKVGDHNEHRAA